MVLAESKHSSKSLKGIFSYEKLFVKDREVEASFRA